jgi:hypothetical protein
MSTAELAQWLEETEKFDPITPQLIQSQFKNDSRAMESLGKRWNIPSLEDEAAYNQANPEEGIANASKATAMAFLGNWAGGAAGAAGGAVPPMAEMGGPVAAQTALQMQQAAQASGGLGAFWNQLTNNGGYVDQIGNVEEGLNAGSRTQGLMGFKMGPQSRRMMMNQAQGLMNPPPQAPPPPPPPRPQPQQQPISPYQNLSEEEKQRLRMQGYNVY